MRTAIATLTICLIPLSVLIAAPATLSEANTAYKEDRHEESIRLFTELIESQPAPDASVAADFHYKRAYSLFHLKRFAEACTDLYDVLELGTETADVHNLLALVYSEAGEVDVAVEHGRRAVELGRLHAHENLNILEKHLAAYSLELAQQKPAAASGQQAVAGELHETTPLLAATNAAVDFEFQRAVLERIRATNELPTETFFSDLDRVQASLAKLQRACPENSSQAATLGRLRQELNYSLATAIASEIDYARLTDDKTGELKGVLSRLQWGAPSDQAAKFTELIADVQMRRIQGLTQSTEVSWRDDEEAERRYQWACADAPKDKLSSYEALYTDYVAHAGKLKEAEAEKRWARARSEPASNEWVAIFQDPRLIDQPAAPVATPTSGGYQPGAAAQAQSTQRYCMTCSGTGSRTVWEDAYDTYSRQWGRQQVRKSCDRCGGTGTLR